jgi:hypothetical protein
MKTISFLKNTFVVAVLLAVLFPILGEAGPIGKAGPLAKDGLMVEPLVFKNCLQVRNRPLSDFLKAQGTLNNPPQFFPPVKDYVGWADVNLITFALVDYAGLANEYIKAQTGHSLGTAVRGYVTECKLADGSAQITVAIFTTNALGFAQSIEDLTHNNFDFLNTPTIFGAKAKDVVNRKDAALGPVALLTTFSIPKPGAPLPDFLDVVNNAATYAPATVNFMSTTFGKCANGKIAHLDVHQVASTNQNGQVIEWKYSTESVHVGC